MPLVDVDFDAGVTSITEAMAMGKAVIVTRTKGQVDVIHDGVEGLYVPPADPAALREAIVHLLKTRPRRLGWARRVPRSSSATGSTTTSPASRTS